MNLTITIIRDEDGLYIAECPAIPGCISQGKAEAEAPANVQDAIKQCLEVRAEMGRPLTVLTRQVEAIA
jgi:predicted RNase H-like HicB family nuclease